MLLETSLIPLISFQPLTDVQQACPYGVCEADCLRALTQLQSEKIKCCPGYKYNIAMYKPAIEFVTSCALHSLLKDGMEAAEKGSDKDALDFFSETTLEKYPEAVQMFKKVYETMKSIPVSKTCTMFSFL